MSCSSLAGADSIDALPREFSGTLLAWQQKHGRHGLPWQNTPDPYRVWLSEIMLQQTQVRTALKYFQRFLTRFPDVAALAAASSDDVFAYWAGLGYYRRARNLHRCAQEIQSSFGGRFPSTAAQLECLPGIGPSTAAAIASFCFGERAAIFDGNVKRVLARVTGFEKDLSIRQHDRALYSIAQALLPPAGAEALMPRYTQAIMDLGATVCTARQPLCNSCPMKAGCKAYAMGSVHRLPFKAKALRRGKQAMWLLWATRSDGCTLLVKRPNSGIWAGLHCLPAFDSEAQLRACLHPDDLNGLVQLSPIVHVLTHKDLVLHVHRLTVSVDTMDPDVGEWLAAHHVGMPAPIQKLLAQDAAGAK